MRAFHPAWLGLSMLLALPCRAALMPQLEVATVVARVTVTAVSGSTVTGRVTRRFKGHPGQTITATWHDMPAQRGFFAQRMQVGMSTIWVVQNTHILEACASTGGPQAPMAKTWDAFLSDYVHLSAQPAAARLLGLVKRLNTRVLTPSDYFPDDDLGTDWIYGADWGIERASADTQAKQVLETRFNRLRALVQEPDPYRMETAVNLATVLPEAERKTLARDLLAVYNRPPAQPQPRGPLHEMTLGDARGVEQARMRDAIPVLLDRLMYPERPQETGAQLEKARPGVVQEAERWSRP